MSFYKQYKFILYIVLLIAVSCVSFLGGCKKVEPVKVGATTTDTTTVDAVHTESPEIEITTAAESAKTSTESIAAENITGASNTTDNISEDPDKILFTFTVAGDNRPANNSLGQPDVFLKLLGFMVKTNPVFFINTGDIINGNTNNKEVITRQLNDYLDAISVLGRLNFVSCGNHDVLNSTSRKYFSELINTPVFEIAESQDIWINTNSGSSPAGKNYSNNNDASSNTADQTSTLYYYFKYENVYFVILNAYEEGLWGFIKTDQLAWLEKTLEVLKDKNVFVFVHAPPYSYLNPDTITNGTKHVAFSSKENQDHIRQLFKEFKVDAVFSGHEHMYHSEFHDGTEYIITGCSGAYPYVPEKEGGFYHFLKIDVKTDSWVFTVIDKNGEVFYKNEISFN